MDPWISDATRDARAELLRPLAHHLAQSFDVGPAHLLDVGCGDLLLADLVPPTWHVTGWDPSDAARRAAQRQAARIGDRAAVLTSLGLVPAASVDLISLSSVTQYLGSVAALRSLFCELAPLLRTPARSSVPPVIVITDVIDPPRQRITEAGDLVAFLARRMGPLRALSAIRHTAARSPGNLTAFSEHDIASASRDAGLDYEKLDDNLTAFRTRSSYILRRKVPDPGDAH